MPPFRYIALAGVLSLFIGLGCDSSELLEAPIPEVPVQDTEHFFRLLSDSTDFIWQNETVFSSEDLEEYTRASLITFLNSDTFGGHDGCKGFVGKMEHLSEGRVRVSGLIDYPECSGGIDLKADTFQVYSTDRRIEFRSKKGGFTLRTNYTKDIEEVGLAGSWSRVRVEKENTGQVIPSGFFNLKFRTDRRFDSEGTCRNGAPTCTWSVGSFFGISDSRFLTYHFHSEILSQNTPEIDYDFRYSSYYQVEGDTLLMWGSPMGHRHVFAKVD